MDFDSLKNNWKAALAVVGIFILIFELFAMGLLSSNSILAKLGGSKSQQQLAQVEFKGSIRTYEPFLFIPSGTPLSGSLLNEIRNLSGVVQLSQEQGGTVIKLETRDDVYPVALALKKKNITTYTLANIAAPSDAQALLENGQVINVTMANVAIRAEAIPLIPLDSAVAVKMTAVIQDNAIVQYGNAVVKSEEKTVYLSGDVQEELIEQTFYVPWEERNNINESMFENITFTYKKNNLGIFSQEIPTAKVMEAKKFDYVTYIDKNSVVFIDNFTDKQRAENDFGVNISFDPSILVIRSKDKIALPYNSSSSYVYKLNVSSADYSLLNGLESIEITSKDKIESNKVNISATAQTIGPVIISISNTTILTSQ